MAAPHGKIPGFNAVSTSSNNNTANDGVLPPAAAASALTATGCGAIHWHLPSAKDPPPKVENTANSALQIKTATTSGGNKAAIAVKTGFVAPTHTAAISVDGESILNISNSCTNNHEGKPLTQETPFVSAAAAPGSSSGGVVAPKKNGATSSGSTTTIPVPTQAATMTRPADAHGTIAASAAGMKDHRQQTGSSVAISASHTETATLGSKPEEGSAAPSPSDADESLLAGAPASASITLPGSTSADGSTQTIASAAERHTPSTSTATIATSAAPSSPSLPSIKPGVVVLPKRALGKRPSPWREPRMDHQLPPPAKDIVVNHGSSPKPNKRCDPERAARKAARKKKRLYAKLFSDSVTVHIPLTVTANVGVALQRTRAKRVAALYQHFPSLQPFQPPSVSGSNKKNKAATAAAGTFSDDNNKNDNDDDDDALLGVHNDKTKGETTADDTNNKDGEKKKKLQKLKHVPQPHEYASVIDYLEAKYVQGVVVLDDGESGTGGDDDDENEGQGSVYSETSFLDDTGLQRTVAEQVLGHQTTTKLEMLSNDDSFFVNVGDLEVEETDMTQQAYDPLEDTKDSKKKPRKRKKPAADVTKENDKETAATTNSKTKKQKTTAGTAAAAKKPSAAALVESPKKKTGKPAVKEEVEEKKASAAKKKVKTEVISKDPSVIKLQKASKAKQNEVDRLYISLADYIKSFTDDEIPRKAKPKRTRVVVKIPPDNKPGDMITFANPHVPGQKLKVKVPPNTKPGDSFKVTVPRPPDEEEANDDPTKDYNKLSRDFYDKLEDYCRTFDEWCDTEGVYRKALGEKNFQPHFAKRLKFDKLVAEFPADMKTPVNKDYLKKILRRARQNKHKREQTLARQMRQGGSQNGEEKGSVSGSDDDSSSDDDDDDDDDKNEAPAKAKASSPPKLAGKKIKPMRTAVLPELALAFPKKQFNLSDFN